MEKMAQASAGVGPRTLPEVTKGGWEQENVNDPRIIGPANFAVARYNDEHETTLVLLGVTNAESNKTAASGVYYRLTIQVKDGNGKEHLCEALVLENHRDQPPQKLKSFTILNGL